MPANIYMDAIPDLAYNLSIEPANPTGEFHQNSAAIDETFHELSQYIENASAEDLTRLITPWGITEPESAKETKTIFWTVKWINDTLKDSIDSFFNRISNRQLRILLKNSLEIILRETIPCDLQDFAERRMGEIKGRLKGALMSSKMYHMQLLLQQYSE